MALDFPTSPEIGDTHVTAGTKYTWTGDRWMGRAYSLELPYPIYDTDVQIKGDKGTQADVNQALTLAQANQVQNLEQAQGTKSRGYWTHHGGPLPPDGAPGWNMFYMRDAEDQRTQDFDNAKSVLVHAMGSQITDLTGNVILGAAEVGDELIIQDMEDVDGGAYVVTSVDTVEPEGDDYSGSYATLGVEPLGEFTRGSVGPAETCVLKLKKSSAAPVVEGEYLPLSGGTITGPTTFDCPTMVKWDAASSNSYPFSVYGGGKWSFRVGETGVVKIFGTTEINQPSGTALRIKKDGVDKVKIEHGGRIYCAYDLSLDEDHRTVVTRGYVDDKIAAIPEPEVSGGGSFITAYDGNRFYKPGTTDTALSDGDVMFLSNGSSTSHFAAVTHVALPEAGIDWDKFTHFGTIEVRNGGTVCGHLQVISGKRNPGGQSWLISVKNLDVLSNDLDPESGHPCYFRGMFFG